MTTDTGLSARNHVRRHHPAFRARAIRNRIASLRRRGLRTFALIAVAGCLALALPSPASASRGAEARAPAAHAAKHAKPRHEARRAAPRRATASGTRLRDAPQELIPAAFEGERWQSPRAACLAATRRAERVHGLPDGLLTAIALAESGLHAHALNIGGRAHFPESRDEARALLGSARSGASVMAGCVQVNARVHARNGSDWPLDPVVAADWAGGILARWNREQGGGWAEALRRWHGGSPASTQRLVCRVRAKMEVTNPSADLFDGWGCGADGRTRANGAAHLRLATAELRG